MKGGFPPAVRSGIPGAGGEPNSWILSFISTSHALVTDCVARLVRGPRLNSISGADREPRRRSMIDVDRPFRSQDPLDRNVRRGVEGSGVGTWDFEFSTRELTWSNTTRK